MIFSRKYINRSNYPLISQLFTSIYELQKMNANNSSNNTEIINTFKFRKMHIFRESQILKKLRYNSKFSNGTFN